MIVPSFFQRFSGEPIATRGGPLLARTSSIPLPSARIFDEAKEGRDGVLYARNSYSARQAITKKKTFALATLSLAIHDFWAARRGVSISVREPGNVE